MSDPAPLFDTAQPKAVPTAIMSNEHVDRWFVNMTRYCATGVHKDVTDKGYVDRVAKRDTSDQDPKLLIPEESSVLRAWADFLANMLPDLSASHYESVVVLVVNRLATPLTIRLEGGGAIHGEETAFPARRSWDPQHKHHQWERPKGTYKIPAGDHRAGTSGLGVLGIARVSGFRGASAVWSVTPDPSEENLKTPLWFAATCFYGNTDDRFMGVHVTDDTTAYDDHEDYFEKTLNTSPRSSSSCELKKGVNGLYPDANFTAKSYVAMLDAAPLGMTDGSFSLKETADYSSRNKDTYTLQAVLVIDTEGSNGRGATS